MNVEIAERLAKRRREAGYSQESLAEQLGVSRQAVSKWERSESSPDTDNLIALAQLYGVSLDDLLYVDESIREDIAFEATDRAGSVSESVSSVSDMEGSGVESTSNPSSDTSNSTPTSEGDASAADEKTSETDRKKVNVGFGGIHINDGDDYVHVSWRDGVHVKDTDQGDEVHVGWNGVHVKEGKKDDSSEPKEHKADWDDATVIINGEEFESWKDAHNKYGHGQSHKSRGWLKFPFPLLVIIIYILVGIFLNAWLIGLFIFFTIPVYYMLGEAISKRKPSHFFAGIYPLAAVVWFLYMAFVLNQAHPAWVIFLTIPIYEWIVHACSSSRKHRKRTENVIDVNVK